MTVTLYHLCASMHAFRGNIATKSTAAGCVKRLCLGCVDELFIIATFLEFPGVDGEAG